MPAARFDTISFLSDYGLADEFVGVCKAVIRRVAPHATVIDICHEIPPHDVRAGSLALARAAQYLPAGVVLAVVDPGVGGDRRAVAVEAAEGEAVFVGPDNGLMASAVAMVSIGYGEQVRTAVRAESYAVLGPGQIGLVVDSYGLVSVALNRRSAADELRLHPPAEVTLEPAAER